MKTTLEFNKPFTCDLVNIEGTTVVRLNQSQMYAIYRQYLIDSMWDEIECRTEDITDRYGNEIMYHSEDILDKYTELVLDNDYPRTEETLWTAVESVYEDYQ